MLRITSWLISPLNLFVPQILRIMIICVTATASVCSIDCLVIVFLSAHLYKWNYLVLSPFLPFSDHLTRHTFHVVLCDEKGEKLLGEGQRTEVSVWSIQSNLLADSDFAFQKSFSKIVVLMVRSIYFLFPLGHTSVFQFHSLALFESENAKVVFVFGIKK